MSISVIIVVLKILTSLQTICYVFLKAVLFTVSLDNYCIESVFIMNTDSICNNVWHCYRNIKNEKMYTPVHEITFGHWTISGQLHQVSAYD